LYRVHLAWEGFELTTLVVIGTDCIDSYKSNYHMILYRVHLAWEGFELTTLVVIGTDCIDSYKSNYHMIKATTASLIIRNSYTLR
jgi:hypothetical protein